MTEDYELKGVRNTADNTYLVHDYYKGSFSDKDSRHFIQDTRGESCVIGEIS